MKRFGLIISLIFIFICVVSVPLVVGRALTVEGGPIQGRAIGTTLLQNVDGAYIKLSNRDYTDNNDTVEVINPINLPEHLLPGDNLHIACSAFNSGKIDTYNRFIVYGMYRIGGSGGREMGPIHSVLCNSSDYLCCIESSTKERYEYIYRHLLYPDEQTISDITVSGVINSLYSCAESVSRANAVATDTGGLRQILRG